MKTARTVPRCTRLNPSQACTPNLTDCPTGQYCDPALRQCVPRPNCQMMYEACDETKKCCGGTECHQRLHTNSFACFSSASTGEDCTKLPCEGFRKCVNGKCSADRGESCDQFPCPTGYRCVQGFHGGTCEK
ncbi:hypothetical protein BC940DRAFT_289611 [Gongronella butleri]|nr:hypothetical protein BC940DRAFT_289611 [Gongronella butleri]